MKHNYADAARFAEEEGYELCNLYYAAYAPQEFRRRYWILRLTQLWYQVLAFLLHQHPTSDELRVQYVGRNPLGLRVYWVNSLPNAPEVVFARIEEHEEEESWKQNFREKLIRRELHARRWGKLVQLARIRIIGSAGWPTHHMGVEFWHEYPNAPTRREDLEVFTDFVDRTPPTKEAT